MTGPPRGSPARRETVGGARRRPVEVVAFDLMDTVVRDPFVTALAAATGRPAAEVLAHRQPGVWPAFERGELTETEYFASYRGVDVDVEVFHQVRRDGYAFVEGMADLLDELAGQVRRVGASNYPVWVEELTAGLLAGRVEEVVASCHLAARKPSRAFFVRLCAELEVAGQAVLLVDDRAENVTGARAAGLRAHRFAGWRDLRCRLRREGLAV